MKLKLFILIAAALATVLLLDAHRISFEYSINPQINIKEAKSPEDISGSSGVALINLTPNQRLVQEGQHTESQPFILVSATLQTPESSQTHLAEWTNKFHPIFVTSFLAIAFISGGLLWFIQDKNYKNKRANHVAAILQEIDNLERIRKTKPDIYQSIIPLKKN